MRYVVIGAGAIGSVVAAHLPSNRVTLVARGARLAALARGLVVETPRGKLTPSIEIAGDLPPITDQLVCICTKTNDVADIVRRLPTSARVACFTNGLAAERIGRARCELVYGVTVMCPATHLDADHIVAHGSPVAGIFDVGPVDDISRTLAYDLANGGLWSRAIDDIDRWKRTKLILNLANAVDALCGEAARDSKLVKMIRDEGRAIFAAASLPLASPEEDAARRADFKSAPKTSGGSTWQSLARGSAIECRYFNGEIVELARSIGKQAPLNAAILQRIEEAATSHVAPGTIDIGELERSILTIARSSVK